MHVLELAGDHFTMGQQHGRQVYDLRPRILANIEKRMGQLAAAPAGAQARLDELEGVWEQVAPTTLALLRGMAQALQFDWPIFLKYTAASYLLDLGLTPAEEEGCTTWAATGPVTRDGRTLLVKNRDYQPEHRSLQCFIQMRPANGFAYASIGSAGSPGVFSSGMNAAGLAVADTHVRSLDMGPGVARYSAMMDLLERFQTVEEALAYLGGIPHLGNGTLVLADRQGALAVFETGHRFPGVIHPLEGFVVSANHYVTPDLREKWVDANPPDRQGNSAARYARVQQALRQAAGSVDLPWAQNLMGQHGNLDAICCHPELDPTGVTISTVIFEPQAGLISFSDGFPCSAPFVPARVEPLRR